MKGELARLRRTVRNLSGRSAPKPDAADTARWRWEFFDSVFAGIDAVSDGSLPLPDMAPPWQPSPRAVPSFLEWFGIEFGPAEDLPRREWERYCDWFLAVVRGVRAGETPPRAGPGGMTHPYPADRDGVRRFLSGFGHLTAGCELGGPGEPGTGLKVRVRPGRGAWLWSLLVAQSLGVASRPEVQPLWPTPSRLAEPDPVGWEARAERREADDRTRMPALLYVKECLRERRGIPKVEGARLPQRK